MCDTYSPDNGVLIPKSVVNLYIEKKHSWNILLYKSAIADVLILFILFCGFALTNNTTYTLGMQINNLSTCLNSRAYLRWFIGYIKPKTEDKICINEVYFTSLKSTILTSFIFYEELSFGVVT
jgi:hypothetical protein